MLLFIKQNVTVLLLSFSCLSYAQISIAPNGTGGPQGTPPVGTKRSGSGCANGGCVEFKLKPSCFGTNLRAYSAETQMREDEDVVVDFKLKKPSGTEEDNLRIQYPAGLTFDTGGVRRLCDIDEGQSLTSGSDINITCIKPGSDDALKYKVKSWKTDKNPSCYANGGSHGQEYCDYAGVILDADLYIGSFSEDKISCIYRFDSSHKIDGQKVSCLFQSDITDRSADIKVFLNDTDISNQSSVKKTGFINDISVKIGNQLNSMNLQGMVHHGKVKAIKPADVEMKFYQVSEDQNREIAGLVESSGFDPSNGNRSFSLEVKHPGVEGFCGGFYSPLMLFFDNKLPKFNGVSLFPLYGMKPGQRVNWPEKYAPGYFLVDLKGKDKISSHSQLFGRNDDDANGFDALAKHDKNKDGVIDKKDKIFNQLKLWKDENSNGLSEKEELISLSSKDVVSINLDYNSRYPSNFGNRAKAREKSRFTFKQKGKEVKGEIFDIWLSPFK